MKNEELYSKKGFNRRDLENVLKNSAGAVDPTAYEAIRNVTREEEEKERFRKMLHCIFDMCAVADFRIEGRIVLKDLKTGRTWI